jgi:hypothetical protein
MSDAKIQTAIERYLLARHDLLQLGRVHPGRIGGNDNIIGRIGEFIALRFLEGLGQQPTKVLGSSNQGYDLVEKHRKTQVKVITEENQKGRNVRLTEPWNQFVLIELGQHYKPVRVGILSKAQQEQALAENAGWSPTPIVKRTMLGPKGLIGRYGRVYQENELAV